MTKLNLLNIEGIIMSMPTLSDIDLVHFAFIEHGGKVILEAWRLQLDQETKNLLCGAIL